MDQVWEDRAKTNELRQQFDGTGPILVEKNTFIDEAPAPADSLKRSLSAPGTLSSYTSCCGDDSMSVVTEETGICLVRTKTIVDKFKEWCDTSSEVESDQGNVSVITDDDSDWAQQTSIESSLPPMLASQEPIVDFPFNVCPEDLFFSRVPSSMLNRDFGQEAILQMSLGKSAPYQEASILNASSQISTPWGGQWGFGASVNEGREVANLGYELQQAQEPFQPPFYPQSKPPQPHSIKESFFDGYCEFVWNIDARKLQSSDKQAVSPPLDVRLGNRPPVTFKIMLSPLKTGEVKGGASFKKANGHARIDIKCEGDVSGAPAETTIGLAIGNWKVRSPDMRGGRHDFSQCAIFSLPRSEDHWNLASVVDKASETLSVFFYVKQAHA